VSAAAARFARGARARPFVYGHRGTRRGAAENTLQAMELALAQGAEGIELDVRLCGSGEVIVLHDPDLQRVAGSVLVAAEASYTVLAACDLGAGARVPLLDDALSVVLGSGARLNVELKADVPDKLALVGATLRAVRAHPHARDGLLVFSSFDREICAALAAGAPELPVAFLCSRTLDVGPPGMTAIHPRFDLIDARVIADLRAHGLVINTWTVNDGPRAAELAALGVDGIITDDVPLVLAALGG
jgi:glycerophosphoryl diester phosphodiesterase